MAISAEFAASKPTRPKLMHHFPGLSFLLNWKSEQELVDKGYTLGEWRRHTGWEKHESGFHDKLLESVKDLGQGSIGTVEAVKIRGKEIRMARKKTISSGLDSEWKRRHAQKEAETLKSLDHIHIVHLIGQYESPRAFCFLMVPVGDNPLGTFLDNVPREDLAQKQKHCAWIKGWFTCLSSALFYLYTIGIRHEDVKPDNIIQRGNKIFFTDFSSSTRFAPGNQHTSTYHQVCTTKRYASPETGKVICGQETTESIGFGLKHSSKADVFSLGCVFAEMLTVLTGGSLAALREHCNKPSQADVAIPYSHRLPAVSSWFSRGEITATHRKVYKEIVEPMLEKNRDVRPRARDVLRKLQDPGIARILPCTCVPCKRTPVEIAASPDSAGQNRLPDLREPWEAQLQSYDPPTNNSSLAPSRTFVVLTRGADYRTQQNERQMITEPPRIRRFQSFDTLSTVEMSERRNGSAYTDGSRSSTRQATVQYVGIPTPTGYVQATRFYRS